MSGKEAYHRYKQKIAPLLLGIGVRPILIGRFECVLSGPEEQWDQVFVLGWPSVEATHGISKHSDFAGIVKWREAAIEHYSLLRLEPQAAALLHPASSSPAEAMDVWVDTN